MVDNSKEYIICAAIWYDDGISRDDEAKSLEEGNPRTFPAHFRGATFQNTNISTGYVICGWRHGNIISVKPCNTKFCPEIKDTVQGFMTSNGRFVDRWQAAYIAWRAEQPLTNRYGKGYLRKGVTYGISGANIDYLKTPNGTEFKDKITEFMNSTPSDGRFKEDIPFEMMYSEDFY